jgi:hypothetical protein
MLLMLLDQDRLCVHPDDERGFRIEGGFYIPLEERTPGEDDLPGRSEAMVAGARSDRLHMTGRPLVVKMHFSS